MKHDESKPETGAVEQPESIKAAINHAANLAVHQGFGSPGLVAAGLAATATAGVLNGAAPELPDDLNYRRDDEARLKSAISEARDAWNEFGRVTWRLARALQNVRIAYHARYKKDAPKAWLATELGIHVTEQRIGQLVNTLAYFGDIPLADTVDFRVYEEARKQNIRLGNSRLSKEKLALLVKQHRTVDDLLKAMPKPAAKAPAAMHNVAIRVDLAFADGNWVPKEATALMDGSDELLTADYEWIRAALPELRKKLDELARRIEPRPEGGAA